MICGGVKQASEPVAKDQALVNHHIQDLNAQLGVNNTSFKATSVATQCVAGSTIFFA